MPSAKWSPRAFAAPALPWTGREQYWERPEECAACKRWTQQHLILPARRAATGLARVDYPICFAVRLGYGLAVLFRLG
jgi:hypothetical protein